MGGWMKSIQLIICLVLITIPGVVRSAVTADVENTEIQQNNCMIGINVHRSTSNQHLSVFRNNKCSK